MVKLINIKKSFGAKAVLKGINVEFQKGKVYGIVGENGAGKTTLFRCLAGLDTVDGSVESEFAILKNHMGFLQTNPLMLSHITGWEYLKLMCIARGLKTEDFETQNIFDLPLQQYAATYSTGMKKKLALMGILLQQNQVIILDEPFNGVDIHSNMIIVDLIQKLKALNKTILISSHIFSTLSDTCDEIHLLKKGVFVKTVQKADFQQLDEEMKKNVVGNRVAELRLQ